jgi:2-hydroxychromene-2-carboxylate isomerase
MLALRSLVRPRTTAPRLAFWYELASPYSYLAVMRVEAVATQAGVTIDWHPFALGPIFRSLGWAGSPFVVMPVKGRYMWRDVARIAAARGLPFRPPATFPFRTLLATRIAHMARGESWVGAFSREMMQRVFADGADPEDEAVVTAALLEAGGHPAKWLPVGRSAATKASLVAEGERARALGVFGAPTFVVDGELFWGDDRLEQAVDWARGVRAIA